MQVLQLKGGVFLDVEYLVRNGGYRLNYRSVKRLVQAQGAVVLRANAYMAVDVEREEKDESYRNRKEGYRERVRREGFHLVLKQVQRYFDEGEIITKANADVDLAVDALIQTDNLDYILLGTGDGDFVRLVRGLQNRGKRVDLLSFSNTSQALHKEVDKHFNGYLLPEILLTDRSSSERHRGFLHAVKDEGFGFLTIQTGFGPDDFRDDVFLHVTEFRDGYGYPVEVEHLLKLKSRRAVIDFELVKENSKVKATNAREFIPDI